MMLAIVRRLLRVGREDRFSVSPELTLIAKQHLQQVRRNDLSQVRRRPTAARLDAARLIQEPHK
jgi:hypothetical protein